MNQTIHSGSLRSLWKISFSLMISFLSATAMMFFDRLFLAYYSTSALTAATSSGTFFWAGCCLWMAVAGIGEVFVAQKNGAKEYAKLGAPVWQMTYLALLSICFFLVLSHFGSLFFYTRGILNIDEYTFYRWNNLFAPLLIFFSAFASFYIGQGKTSIIKWLALIGNGINIILDPILIFGVSGWIPSMGIKGAAIATGSGLFVQVFIIAAMFLHQKNRKKFGTNDFRFQPQLFIRCIKIGLPPAIFIFFELLGWTTFYVMMKKISSHHLIVSSIAQTILIFFFFFAMGLEKGAAAIAGNLIGAKKFDEIKKVFRSGITLSLIFALVLTLFLVGFPETIFNWFFKSPQALSFSELNMHITQLPAVKTSVKFAMAILVIYLTFENIRYLIAGILQAAGDTLFTMLAGSFSIWFFLLLPTYFFILKPQANIEKAFYIWLIYSLVSTLLFAFRFFQGEWKKKNLFEKESYSAKISQISYD